MTKYKWFLVVLIVAMGLMMSCGDDETGPSSNPTASTLSVSVTNTTASGSWTVCPDDDFAEYNLYRDTSQGVSASSDLVKGPVYDINETTFTDPDLEWGTKYYYALRTTDTEDLHAWSNEESVTPDSGGSGGDALTCYEVQGQQSASPYEGQIVSVTGIVVVGGDEYYSSQYAYAVIMDEGGGAWAGLTLFGSDVAGLARGDSITITGEIQEYYSFTELSYPSAVDVHSTGHTLPAAEALSTGSVAEEQWESVLVSVSDVEVSEDDLGYGEWAVDDGTGDIRIDDLGDYTYEPTVGDTFSEIIGVCMYSYDNWKIEPRDDSDLIE